MSAILQDEDELDGQLFASIGVKAPAVKSQPSAPVRQSQPASRNEGVDLGSDWDESDSVVSMPADTPANAKAARPSQTGTKGIAADNDDSWGDSFQNENTSRPATQQAPAAARTVRQPSTPSLTSVKSAVGAGFATG